MACSRGREPTRSGFPRFGRGAKGLPSTWSSPACAGRRSCSRPGAVPAKAARGLRIPAFDGRALSVGQTTDRVLAVAHVEIALVPDIARGESSKGILVELLPGVLERGDQIVDEPLVPPDERSRRIGSTGEALEELATEAREVLDHLLDELVEVLGAGAGVDLVQGRSSLRAYGGPRKSATSPVDDERRRSWTAARDRESDPAGRALSGRSAHLDQRLPDR